MNKCGQRPTKLDIALIMTQGDHDGQLISFRKRETDSNLFSDNGVITFDEFTALMKGKCSR